MKINYYKLTWNIVSARLQIDLNAKHLNRVGILNLRAVNFNSIVDIPLFGVMTKMDVEEGDWKKLEMEFKRELGIDGNYFIPVVNYLHEDLMTDEPEPNPNIDVPLLKMLNKVRLFISWSLFFPVAAMHFGGEKHFFGFGSPCVCASKYAAAWLCAENRN